jgi:hypothetical protein
VVGGRSSVTADHWSADIRPFLRPLPIDTLWDLKPEVREKMLLLGIRTLGQLATVPQRLLVEQFGAAGRWYRLLARGIDHRRVAAWQPSPTLTETLSIYDDEPTLPVLEAIVDDLAGRLSERLLQAGLYARIVTLVAHLEDGDRRFATHHLKAPTHSRRHLFETATGLLPRILDFGFWILDWGGLSADDADERRGESKNPTADPTAFICDSLRHLRINSPHPKSKIPVALELRVGGLGARGVLQLSIFGEIDRGPALRAAVARIQDRFGERSVRNAVQLLAEIRFR